MIRRRRGKGNITGLLRRCATAMVPLVMVLCLAHPALANKSVTIVTTLDGASSSAGGAVASCGNNGSDTWNNNDIASYSITPNSGYKLQAVSASPGSFIANSWSSAGATCGSLTFPMGNNNQTLTVAFVTAKNTVAPVVTPTGAGTITSCGNGNSNVWNGNGTASYAVTVNNGYLLSSLSLSPSESFTVNNSNPTTGAACGNLTFAMNGQDRTLTATFKPTDTVTRTVYTNGAVSSSGGTISCCGSGCSDTWANDATASYAITPNSGYILSSVAVTPAGGTVTTTAVPPASGYNCSGTPFSFPIGGLAQGLSAYFSTPVSVAPTVYTSYLPSSTGGTITSCNGSNLWGQNTTAYYAIQPAAGYKLTSVNVAPATGSTTTPNPGGYSCSGASFQFSVGASNQSISPNFVPTSSSDINGSTVGGGDIKAGAYNGPTVLPSYSAAQNSTLTLYFIPPSGKGISRVYFDGNDVTSALVCPNNDFTSPGTSNATSCTYQTPNLGTTSHSVSATYDTAYQVTVGTTTSGCGQSSGGGYIGSAPPGATSQTFNVVNGKTLAITLSPNTGFVLKDLQLNGSSQLSTGQFGSYTYTTPPITSNKTVAAYFTPFFTIGSQVISAPAGSTATGTITPATQQVVCGANSAPFTITPTPPATIQDVAINTGGTDQSQGALTSYTFNNVASSATLKVTFNQQLFQLGNYSITPPFVQSAVLPDLLMMIDNSASQYDLQYDSTGQCYDNNSYVDSTTYNGYFGNSALYSFNVGNNRFEQLASGAALPTSCTFRTPFFCVQMAGTKPSRTVSSFVATGNFLNYLATSKLDLQKLILTGGKYDTTGNALVGESRGCMGKRFIKMISNTQASGSLENLAGVTFVVRGPTSSDPDYVNPAVQNGTTRIDIYDAPYNLSSCQSAITGWSDLSNMGQTQNSTTACITGSSPTNLKAQAYIHMTHVCWFVLNGKSIGGNMNSVETDCVNDWQANYQNNPALIVNDQAGDSVCSSVIRHPLTNGRDTGYLGLCYNNGSWDSTCEQNQSNDFCSLMMASQAVDPSGVLSTGSTSSVPAFIIDAGANALGSVAGSYHARVYQTTPPTGLINEFQNYINFGLMVFNKDGAGSECNDGVHNTTSPIPCSKACSGTGSACYLDSDCPSGQTCNAIPKLDGGMIPTGGYIGDPVGDHSSGIINVIDNIQATSWTPFSEAYYDAVGYFANDTTKRLQSQDFDASKPPSSASCTLNNILIITDGASTADQNASVSSLAATYNDGANYGSCPSYLGSKNVSALSWMAYNRNIRNPSLPADHNVNNQYITTWVTYSGPQALSGNGCDPYNLMNSTATNGGTVMYYASTYQTMLSNLRAAFKKIATSSASGTAASILNNSQGSGANLLQAVFFPKKVFSYIDSQGNQQQDAVNWTGELQNLWFYVDPYLADSTVREDTDQDYILSLKNDYVASFGYAQNQATVTLAQDVNGNGSLLMPESTATLDGLNSLWKAGRKLWNRNLSSDPRNIYTLLSTPSVDGSPIKGTLQKFSSADTDNFNSNSTAQSYLQVTGSTAADLKANTNTLVDYISGIDQSGYRSRTVTIPACGLTDAQACRRVWKLGDIVSSTPKLDSNIPLNSYALTPPNGYSDGSYAAFTASNNYQRRGMAFVGGNDGMLHAFRLGILDVSPQYNQAGGVDNDKKARMMYPYGSTASYATSDLGREEWSFIPMNALPYLKYLGDPNYTHLYYVDDTVTLTDMSIGVSQGNSFPNCSQANYDLCQKMTGVDLNKNLDMNNTSWRTVLIGGMGLGGATRDAASSCSDNVATGTCVKTPISGIGYSSYFALDVTNPSTLPDPSNPAAVKLLWEFNANGQLGYSLSGPAIVRIGPANQNGKWYAIFGSGPTGPIESASHTFYGKSDQNLKLFVVDVGTGNLAATIDTGVTNAFAGTLTTSVIDTDRNYSDDAVYIGYVQADTSVTPNTWSKGGVLRLLTRQSKDPGQWTVSPLISGIGPVTTSVAKLQDTKARWGTSSTGATGKLWLYFGSGRYFYKSDLLNPGTPFRIYGVTDPCYSENSGSPQFTPTGPTNAFDTSCSASVSPSNLQDQTGSASAAPATTLDPARSGWFVNLASSETVNGNNYSAERVITNPNANLNGTVFFSTLLPSTDVCGVGGNTYIWAFKYDTGAAPLTATMQGSILLQVSTGDLQQVNLSTAFKNPLHKGYNMRRLAAPIAGVPPTGSGMVGMNRPAPTKKLLHIQEK
ncbi:MAG TPA: hypothetical protein VJ550_13275 [Geomonas sp.]|nr:hypothetical protein [Geomonas sp.]